MKLVITEPKDFSKDALKLLSENFEVVELQKIDELEKHIQNVDLLFIRLGIIFNQAILKKAETLKAICTTTTGLDHIDIKFCIKNNIKVISLKGEREFLDSIPSTAEHTWTLLTALNRRLYLAAESVNSKQWDRNQFKSYNLKNKTLGILGLGRVGKQMAKYAIAFGMNVIGYDKNPDINIDDVTTLNSAEELFTQSDFISIHIPLNEDNIEFVNEDLIKLIQTNACIINTSRGKVWDEKAIKTALIQGKIRGVATDVIYDELADDWQNSPILSINPKKYNCIVTPHIAGATFDSMHMTEVFIVKKLLNHVS